MTINITANDLTEEGKIVLNHYLEFHKDISGFAKQCIAKSFRAMLDAKKYGIDVREAVLSLEGLDDEKEFMKYLSSLSFCVTRDWVEKASNDILSSISDMPEGVSVSTTKNKGVNVLVVSKKWSIPINGDGILTENARHMYSTTGMRISEFMKMFCDYYVYKKLDDKLFMKDFGAIFPGCSCVIGQFSVDENGKEVSCPINYSIPFGQISEYRLREILAEIRIIPTYDKIL